MAAKETALTIKRNFPRATLELVKNFSNLPTGNVCDAQGRVGALDYRIKPVGKASQFCGIALTVDAGPRDNLAAWAALEFSNPGDIILIATGGHLESSVVGDLYVGMSKNAGVAGNRNGRGRSRFARNRCGRHSRVCPGDLSQFALEKRAGQGGVADRDRGCRRQGRRHRGG